MTRTFVLGTRGSALALWQANWVKDTLARIAPEASIELKIIKTSGDRITDRPLAQVPGVGFFVKEIEDALLRREIDLAVHSMKDMPVAQPAGLVIAAMPAREEPYDALVTVDGRTLDDLPSRARIGTSSLRRIAQLANHRGDLAFVQLRGNVDTRIRKLSGGECEAIVLAEAGLRRLTPKGIGAVRIEGELMLPAAGQGALGIEVRSDDADAVQLVGKLEDAKTRIEVTAERRVLGGLGGGCSAPIGTLARVSGDALVLEGVVGDPSGKRLVRAERRGAVSAAGALADDLVKALLASGGAELVALTREKASWEH